MAFNDRVVIVTGGANGIGAATSTRFAQQGAKVAIWDLQEEAGETLASQLQSEGHDAVFSAVNVTNSESVNTAVQNIQETWGRVDVLVNNAGIVRDGQLVKVKNGKIQKTMSDEAFDAVIDVNLKGVFVCTRAVVP